jgi:putative transposase
VIKKGKKYPLSIRNDLIKMEHRPNTVAEYWVRIQVKSIKGGLWIGLIKPYEPIPTDAKICESKLYKKDNSWFLDLVVEKDIPEKLQYQNVIGIDMGIRHIATSVELANGLTKFYGKDLNRVRGHYFWLRRKLGIKKAIDAIKKIGSHEKRIANVIIHNISRDIVNQAINTDAIIVLGDIKHLRMQKQNTRGRKFNRKLSGFQYYKLTQYIKYKAALSGIKVIQVSEAMTSQYCRKCYQKGVRKIHGLFTCAKCGEENADRNAAFNIAYRALGYISKVGVTFASVDRNAMMTKEVTCFNRR